MDVGKRIKELVSSTTQYQFQGPFTSSSLIPATLNRRRPLSGRIWQRDGSPLELVMMAVVDWSITVPALGLHWRRVIDSHELPYRAQTPPPALWHTLPNSHTQSWLLAQQGQAIQFTALSSTAPGSHLQPAQPAQQRLMKGSSSTSYIMERAETDQENTANAHRFSERKKSIGLLWVTAPLLWHRSPLQTVERVQTRYCFWCSFTCVPSSNLLHCV